MKQNSHMNRLDLFTDMTTETKKDFVLICVDPKNDKTIKVKDAAKGFGIPLLLEELKNTDIMILLSRNGPFALQFIIVTFKTLRVIKRLNLQILKANLNHRQSIKVCSQSKTFLFYHESTPRVEVRSISSLKIKNIFDLEQMAEALNVSKWLPQIQSSIDFIPVPEFDSYAMILGPKIVLVSTNRSEGKEYFKQQISHEESSQQLPFACQTIFDCIKQELKENFVTLDYDSTRKLLLAVGISSYLLLQMGDGDYNVVTSTKILRSDKIKRGMRLLRWDPNEQALIVAQRTAQNTVKCQILDYKSNNEGDSMISINILKEQSLKGEVYNPSDRRLYFIETDYFGRREIKTVYLRDFRNKYTTECDEDGEVAFSDFESEHFAYLPDFTEKHQYFYLRFFMNYLAVKPSHSLDESFGKDIAFKV